MWPMTDSSDMPTTVALMRGFETPQGLADHLYETCVQTSKQPSTVLYYDVVSLQGQEYLMAVTENHGDQAWLFSELKRRQPLPSLAQRWPAILWLEREIAEKSQRKIRHYPYLQRVFQPHEHLPQPRAVGAGVFSLPLGPVRADVTESAFFLFETVGEQIMSMQPQLFYKHRGIESLARGQSIADGLLLAERISGTAGASHAAAFVRAVEQATEVTVTESVQWERTLFTEFERMYNHVGDLSQMASAAGMTVGQAQLSRVKEELLRLCADLTGSRYLHGAIRLFSGTTIDWRQWMAVVERRLEDMHRRVERFVSLLVKTPTFVDRLLGTGIVAPEWAQQYGTVGPVARACGVRTDARTDHLDMENVGYHICVSERAVGDAKDRFDVRVAEWQVSLTMVRNMLRRLAELPRHEVAFESRSHPGTRPNGWGIGLSEGPRGRIAHVVLLQDGRILHYGIRSASAWNWPVFGLATANGNIQTDFPVIDASFGLSCAGIDR